MEHPEKALSAAAIKYLLTIAELCGKDREQDAWTSPAAMGVSKPGAHSMIRNLCEAGLAEKERYGTVFLTDSGREAAELYGLPAIVRCAAGCRKRWAGGRDLPERGLRPSLRRSRNGSQSLPCA